MATVTQTENQLPIYSSVPADLAAVTVTTGGTYYMVGYSNGPGSSTINLSAGYAAGTSTIALAATTSFYVGEHVIINGGHSTAEILTISAISSPNLTFSTPTIYFHANSEAVVGSSASFTPSYSGRLEITVAGTLTGANGKTVNVKLVVGSAVSAAAPAAAAAATGTVIGNLGQVIALTGALTQSFAVTALTGADSATNTAPSGGAVLTVGTPYWFDLQITSTSNGDTPQAKLIVWTIEEV